MVETVWTEVRIMLDRFLLSTSPVKKTASALIYTGPAILHGFLLGTDGVNDPIITLYDYLSAGGQEIIPTASYDASQLGLNGVTGIYQLCAIGIYLEVTCAGTCEVNVQYTPCRYTPDQFAPSQNQIISALTSF